MSGHGWDSSRRREHRSGSGWAEDRAAKRILRRDEHRCYLCGGPADEVDHVVPYSQGGLDVDENKRACCSDCHRAKTEREKQAALARRPSPRRQVERHPGMIDPPGPAGGGG